MSFILLTDYRPVISVRDLQALARLDEPSPDLEPIPEDEDDEDGDGSPDPYTPSPMPAMSLRYDAEQNAMSEVATYLRGRFDMEAAFAARGPERNRQLVALVVDVAVWNLSSRVDFSNVSEVREIRYKAAIAWLKLAERGQSNPNLPSYAPDPAHPQARLRFRYGSNPRRSHSF